MGSSRIRLGILALCLLAGGFLYLFISGRRHVGPKTAGTGHGTATASTAVPKPAATVTEERSELANNLNSPSADVHSDLRIVNGIFQAYRSAVREEDPVGENREITAALVGRNKLGFAFIPADCPALNTKGELCDRWGTPYFFHQISGQKMEIRSAGPDRKLWDSDDEVLTPE